MKLKKLEVTGFKSFLDKTAITFPPGISAIVGPNGCGKSNIVDALRWVMGEQSVKQLRGKTMEDIIFSGANGKQPLGMAEVSLTLLNDNGSAPEEFKDFTEIQVTRRLYRSGESGYFLNKQPCRLKDIHNLFLGAGMGAKTYAVIQQGKIGAITDASPEDRRVFIEEAAGISRFKSRKLEALRKLEQTNTNLLRILDILSEVKRQAAALKRQAKKAELHKKLKRRAKVLDVRIALVEHDRYIQKIEEVEKILEGLQTRDLEHSSQLQQLEALSEEIKLNRMRKNEEISAEKARAFEAQRAIDRIENDIAHTVKDIRRLTDEIENVKDERREQEGKIAQILSEIEGAEKDAKRYQREIEDLKAVVVQKQGTLEERRSALDREKEELERRKTHLADLMSQEARFKNVFETSFATKQNLHRRLDRIRSEKKTAAKTVEELTRKKSRSEQTLETLATEVKNIAGTIDALRGALDEEKGHLSRQVKNTQALEMERNEIRSRYNALKKMEDNYEWYKEGVRALLKARDAAPREGTLPAAQDILGLAADIFEPEPSFETAVEAALGDALQYVLVENQNAGETLIAHLKKSGAGRSGMIPLTALKAAPSAGPLSADHPLRLLNHVKVHEAYAAAAEVLLGNIRVTETLADAVTLWNQNGSTGTIVTKEGDLITSEGILVGGSKEQLTGILAKKKELKSLGADLSDLEDRLGSARDTLKTMESKVREVETRLQQAIESQAALSKKQAEAEKTDYILAEERKHAVRHLEILDLEEEQILGEAEDIDADIARFRKELEGLGEALHEAREACDEMTSQIRNRSEEMERLRQEVVDLKLNLTALSAKRESSVQTLNRLKTFHEEGRRRLEDLSAQSGHKSEQIRRLEAAKAEWENALRATYADVQAIEALVEKREAEYHAIEARLKENEGAAMHIQKARESLTEQIRLLAMELSEHQVKRENVVEQLQERYQTPFEVLAREIEDAPRDALQKEPDAPGESMEAMREALADLKKRIDRIGDVNMGALKEYEELTARHDFLETQKEDLTKAVEDLHQVIKKINRITRERFVHTFNAINEKLKEVFPRLFEGGTAELVMTEPDNILETGVEFMIHPPGKRVTRMSLLSGGEKALSAIALIFSIFLLKPASFCLMDEIDAPLDDVNIHRFNNLLKIIGEKSQIILITHNKKSMEFADTLFGITMEQKGISKIVSVNLTR
ncbi:MAG: chromosome segregation protein SMC [Deltaproteobacteria bacterium]|nr:chromosome segregation protein SMC [Deltaproteobacteria bacterium]